MFLLRLMNFDLTSSQKGNQLSLQLVMVRIPQTNIIMPVIKMMIKMAIIDRHDDVTVELSSSFCLDIILDICFSLTEGFG